MDRLRRGVLQLVGAGLDDAAKKRLASDWLPAENEAAALAASAGGARLDRTKASTLDELRQQHTQAMDELETKLKDSEVERSFAQRQLTHERAKYQHEEETLKQQLDQVHSRLDKEERKAKAEVTGVLREREALDTELATMRTQLETTERERRAAEEEAAKWQSQAPRAHPVLGSLVAEAPGRRVYMTDIASLAACQVWEKQRAFREERATAMATDLIRKANKAGKVPRPFAGAIVLADTSNDFDAMEPQRLFVLDGQHRIGAMAILLAKQAFGGAPPPPMLVEVYHLRTPREMASLFLEINKAEPVLEIDLPELDAEMDGDADASNLGGAASAVEPESGRPALTDSSGEVQGDAGGAAMASPASVANAVQASAGEPTATPAAKPEAAKAVSNAKAKAKASGLKPRVSKAQLRDAINFAAEELQFRYPDMFRPTTRCRAPHVHLNSLREALFSGLTGDRLAVGVSLAELDGKTLLQWLEETNEAYAKLEDADWEELIGKKTKEGKAMSDSSVKALAKARKHHFFLGLTKEWLAVA